MKTPTFTKAFLRLHFLCFFFGIGASVWGYNIGILSSVLVHAGWKDTLGDPGPSKKGIITGLYYLGTFFSYIFISHPLSDVLGRRYAAFCGVCILVVGALLQASSSGTIAFGMMVTGRLLCGVGVAIVSTSVPLYQSEISPAKQRGRFVTMNHIGFVAGLAAGLWVGYGMTFWTSPTGLAHGWRLSLLLQLVPAFVFAAGLPFLPESPRWLIERGDRRRADAVLRWLREGSFSSDDIENEADGIQASVDAYRSSNLTWSALFTEPSLFARLWRAALLQFMAQMVGATAMKYYLPTLLKALGLGTRLALMAGAIEMTLKIGCTVVEMFIIDRFGRRVSLAAGCAVMALSMMVNGILPSLFPGNVSKLADTICVAFIFLYAFGYSMSFGPSAWVYASEIFPTTLRARGLNFSASGGSIGSIIVSQIWPVGIHRFGHNIYFFFMTVNLVGIPMIYLFFPETKGRSLENMDDIFGVVPGASAVANRLRRNAANSDDDEASNDSDEESDHVPLRPRQEYLRAPLIK